MNNKGFAISSILYLLITIAGILLLSTLGAITFRKDILTSKFNAINRELEGSFTYQYRYITEGGEWSRWIDYQDKSEINHTVNINRLPNLGTRGSQYNLNNTTNLVLEIVNGEAYIKLNGTDSRAISGIGEETVINSAILEIKKENTGGIVGFSNSTIDGFYFTNASGYENTFRVEKTTNYLTSTVPYDNNEIYKYVVSLDKETGSYFVYQNGSLVEMNGYTDIKRITEVKLGYLGHTSNPLYFKGNIYNVTLLTSIISKGDAKEISEIGSSNNLELYDIRPEIKYDFIEYRMVDINDKESSNDTFKTRYIKDFSNSSTLAYNPYIEMEAYARFEQYDDFKSIIIGGSYSGTYEIGVSGKVAITSGNFTHPNFNIYNVSAAEVITPYSLPTSYGSGLILFVGSDLTRFDSFAKPFVYAEFSDRGNTGYNEWYYYNGTNWLTFTPQDDDAIVGYVLKKKDSSDLNSVELFNQSFTFNVALGKSITSSNSTSDISRVVDGKIGTSEYFNNGLGSQNIEIDLGEEYNITKVRIFRGEKTDNVVVYDTKTALYNADKANSLILWESADKGLYVENSNGFGTSLYVNQSRMPKTVKTRYVEDCSAGKYLVGDNSYEDVAKWHEIRTFDLNGYNVGLNKNISTSNGLNLNLNNIIDGNNLTLYTGGKGIICITIDLGNAYAVKEINAYRNNADDINAYVRTGLINDPESEQAIFMYDSHKEGLYKEPSGGLRYSLNRLDFTTKEEVEEAYVINDSLIVDMPLGDAKTGDLYTDRSGLNNHGTNYETISTPDRFNIPNKASYLSSSSIQIGDIASQLGNNMTYSVWVNRESSLNSYNMFMGQSLPYFAHTATGKFLFAINLSGAQTNLSSNYNYVDNTWYHFVATYDGVDMKLYINGILENEQNASGAVVDYSAQIFTLGDGRGGTSWYPFNGRLDDLKIYNRALTAEEINYNYNIEKDISR